MSDSVDSLPDFADDTDVSIRYPLPDAAAMIARANRHISIEVAAMIAVEICERMLEGAKLHPERLWLDIVGHLQVYKLKGRTPAPVDEMIGLLLPMVHPAARPQFQRVLRAARGTGTDRVAGLRTAFAAVLYPIDRVSARASLSRAFELATRQRDGAEPQRRPIGHSSGEGPQSLDLLLSGLDDSVFEDNATPLRASLSEDIFGPSTNDEAPDRFGKFEVFGEIARGGMAQVMLARDPADGLVCVVKRMLPWHEDQPTYQQMFKDEARLGLRLSHPNICRTLAYFGDAQQSCIQMEWAHGLTLAQLIEFVANGATVSVSLVLEVGLALCAALEYAYTAKGADGRPLKVIHRDVSPQNVILQYDGAIKLLDFGVAHSLLQSEKTEAGQVKGKYAYMSPEQALGHPLDDRSDVFCVGICLYEALTGQPLFDRGDRLATIRAMAAGEIPDITAMRPDVSPKVAAILRRALSAQVKARPHMHDLSALLLEAAESLGRPTRRGVAEEVRDVDADWQDWRAKLIPYVDLGIVPRYALSHPAQEEDDDERPTARMLSPLRADPTAARSPRAFRAAVLDPASGAPPAIITGSADDAADAAPEIDHTQPSVGASLGAWLLLLVAGFAISAAFWFVFWWFDRGPTPQPSIQVRSPRAESIQVEPNETEADDVFMASNLDGGEPDPANVVADEGDAAERTVDGDASEIAGEIADAGEIVDASQLIDAGEIIEAGEIADAGEESSEVQDAASADVSSEQNGAAEVSTGPTGFVVVSLRPVGTTVSLADNPSEPRVLEPIRPGRYVLPIGRHRLRFENEGYRTSTRIVRIRRDRTTRLWLRLRRQR